MNDNSANKKKVVFDSCPHCGYRLSPWQQVLLSVDRALMCKNCWYRILLEPFEGGTSSGNTDTDTNEDQTKNDEKPKGKE